VGKGRRNISKSLTAQRYKTYTFLIKVKNNSFPFVSVAARPSCAFNDLKPLQGREN
jgi:hypothetical protein